MSNSVIGALRVMLGMDTSAFEDGANRAKRKNKELETDFQRLGAGLQKVGLAMAGALTGALGAFAVLTRETINTADELSKAASKTGIAVDELSRLRYAADLSGVSFDGLQTAAGRLARGMFEASQGTGGAARAFQALGISVTGSDGQLRSVTDVMGDVADRFVGMKDGAEKTALAMQIFGRAGAEMIPMLNGGRDGLRELTAEADRFGTVIDAETGRKAEAFNDNLSRLQGVFSALATRVAVELLPHLVNFTNWLVENRADIDRSVAKFGDFVNGVVRLSRMVASATEWMEERFGKVWRVISAMINPLQTLIGLVSRFGERSSGGWLGSATASMWDMGQSAMETAKAFKAFEPVAFSSGGAIARGIGGGARRASADLRQLSADADALKTRVQALLDRLFPEMADARKRAEDLALLDQAQLSEEMRARARLRVLGGGPDKPKVSEGLLSEGPLAEVGKVRDAVKAMVGQMTGLADQTEVQTVRIAENFQQMADRALGHLRRLVDGIRGGGFLSILEGIIGIGTTLGSMGVFGKKMQANLQRTPGFANGGAMRLGGFAGIDRNVLSLNGSPIARVSAGETMQIRPANDRAGGAVINNYYTLPSQEFWSRVDGRAAGVVAQSAPAIAGAGASIAQAQMAQRARRRVR